MGSLLSLLSGVGLEEESADYLHSLPLQTERLLTEGQEIRRERQRDGVGRDTERHACRDRERERTREPENQRETQTQGEAVSEGQGETDRHTHTRRHKLPPHRK